MEHKRELRSYHGLKIEGFANGKRTYGGARCYRATVNGRYPAAVLVIDRTHYDDSVMEIISPVNFRKELGLKNGDKVNVVGLGADLERVDYLRGLDVGKRRAQPDDLRAPILSCCASASMSEGL